MDEIDNGNCKLLITEPNVELNFEKIRKSIPIVFDIYCVLFGELLEQKVRRKDIL